MAACTCHCVSSHEGRPIYQGGYGGHWNINTEIRGEAIGTKGLRTLSPPASGALSACVGDYTIILRQQCLCITKRGRHTVFGTGLSKLQ